MAVVLSSYGLYATGTTPVENRGFVVIDTSAGTQAVTLPANLPAGYSFDIIRNGANTVTLVAPAGATISGADLVGTDGGKLKIVKSSATVFRSYETATYS